MSRRRAPLVLALALAVVACGPSEEEQAADRAAAIDLVERFGTRLMLVSLQAPPDSVMDAIRDVYGPYVTTLQLGHWLTDPRTAPGRATSSPYPARIEVRDATPFASIAYDVTGDIVYVANVDGEPVMRQPVTVRVVRGPDNVWRISEWNASP